MICRLLDLDCLGQVGRFSIRISWARSSTLGRYGESNCTEQWVNYLADSSLWVSTRVVCAIELQSVLLVPGGKARTDNGTIGAKWNFQKIISELHRRAVTMSETSMVSARLCDAAYFRTSYTLALPDDGSACWMKFVVQLVEYGNLINNRTPCFWHKHGVL